MDQASDNFFHLNKPNYLCHTVGQAFEMKLNSLFPSFSILYEAQPGTTEEMTSHNL